MRGKFKVQHIRKGEVIGEYDFPNGITNEGKNSALDILFNAAAQPTWYIGLINNSPAPTLAAADTMASHAGWSETTDYDEANRVTWNPEAAASQSVANTVTSADFTINATVTVYGIFVATSNTKGGATGTLWATAAFPSPVGLVDDDLLKVIYTVSA
jgi:hypothetical protein